MMINIKLIDVTSHHLTLSDVIYTHNVICNYKLHTRVIELQITNYPQQQM